MQLQRTQEDKIRNLITGPNCLSGAKINSCTDPELLEYSGLKEPRGKQILKINRSDRRFWFWKGQLLVNR